MKPEHILAVEGSLFGHLSPFEPMIYDIEPKDFANENLFLIQRQRAETDEHYRHIIPYTVILNSAGQVLAYQRGKGAGEQRLAGQKSIGFGGHVDLNDVRFAKNVIDFGRTISDSGYRELVEEIGVFEQDITTIETVGMILDDSNAVGRVHVGILQRAKYSSNKRVISQEEGITLLGWHDLDTLDASEFEPWSACAIRFMRGEPAATVVMDGIDVKPALRGKAASAIINDGLEVFPSGDFVTSPTPYTIKAEDGADTSYEVPKADKTDCDEEANRGFFGRIFRWAL